MASLTPVRAAGGVLWRPGTTPERAAIPEVAVVHRPRYDDWSLPKGKTHRGEHLLVTACREVWEESGVRARPGLRLPAVSYPVRLGATVVTKIVDYWTMTIVDEQELCPGAEVDAMAWLPIDQVSDNLTYQHDRAVVAAFAALPLPTAVVVLLRHASAGKRSTWGGNDLQRPLDPAGARRAGRVATILECFTPGRLVAGPARRCGQTLEPLAHRTRLAIESDPAFAESADLTVAAHRIVALATDAAPTVVCGHRALIPPVLSLLTGEPAERFRTAKGAGWVLSFAGSVLVKADALP